MTIMTQTLEDLSFIFFSSHEPCLHAMCQNKWTEWKPRYAYNSAFPLRNAAQCGVDLNLEISVLWYITHIYSHESSW